MNTSVTHPGQRGSAPAKPKTSCCRRRCCGCVGISIVSLILAMYILLAVLDVRLKGMKTIQRHNYKPKPGDIILIRTNSIKGRLIRVFGGSYFNHVGVIAYQHHEGKGDSEALQILHSMGDTGVIFTPIDEFLEKSYEEVWVRELEFHIPDCYKCNGTGRFTGYRCHACDGFGKPMNENWKNIFLLKAFGVARRTVEQFKTQYGGYGRMIKSWLGIRYDPGNVRKPGNGAETELRRTDPKNEKTISLGTASDPQQVALTEAGESRIIKNSTFFCSELVAFFLSELGILSSDTMKAPHEYFPGDFEKEIRGFSSREIFQDDFLPGFSFRDDKHWYAQAPEMRVSYKDIQRIVPSTGNQKLSTERTENSCERTENACTCKYGCSRRFCGIRSKLKN